MTHFNQSFWRVRATLLALCLLATPSARAAAPKLEPDCAGLILNDRSDDAALQRDLLGRFARPAQWTLRSTDARALDADRVVTTLRASNAAHPAFAVDFNVEHRPSTGAVERVELTPIPTAAVATADAFVGRALGETLAPDARARARAFWGLRVDEVAESTRLVRTSMRPGHSVIYVEFEVEGRADAGRVTRPVVFVVHPNRHVEAVL